jgi:hypothetical protein
MSEAIERIVGAYIKLCNRKALEDMKAHRRRLADELKSINGTLDLSSSIKQLEGEIAIIEAGPYEAEYRSRRLMFAQGRLASLPGRPEIQHRLSGICSLGGVGISEVGSLNPGSFDAARCMPTLGKRKRSP